MFRLSYHPQADRDCQSIHNAWNKQTKTTYYRIPPATRHILTLTLPACKPPDDNSAYRNNAVPVASLPTPSPISKLIVRKECDDPL
jgi:hypothetical protein